RSTASAGGARSSGRALAGYARAPPGVSRGEREHGRHREPQSIGIRPFHEFDEANATWPRGARLEAIRRAADEFRARFKTQGQVTAIRTIDLVSAGYPARYAFGGAAKGYLNPYINITNRLVVVQFHDFEGALKTL